MSDDKSDHAPEDISKEEIAVRNHDSAHTDIGLEYFLRLQDMDPIRRDEVAKRILKKIDFCLLPATS